MSLRTIRISDLRIGNFFATAMTCVFFAVAGTVSYALLAAPVSAAETQYISDNTYIPLRTGQGNQYRIRMNLKTGDKLTVMENSADTQWSRVMTDGGTEGWVQSQYLSNEPPAKLQLENTLQKSTRLEQQLQELKQQNRELSSSNTELTRNVSNESQTRSAMADELQKIKTLSADAIALEGRYRELAEQKQKLETEKEKLASENKILKADQSLDYMLYGATLVLVGVLLAIAVPALKPKKRQSEWR